MTVDVGDSVQTKIIKSLPVSRTVLSFRMITSDHKLEGMDDSGYDNQHHWYTCSSFARIDWFLSGLVQYQQQLSLLNHIVFFEGRMQPHKSCRVYIYILYICHCFPPLTWMGQQHPITMNGAYRYCTMRDSSAMRPRRCWILSRCSQPRPGGIYHWRAILPLIGQYHNR